MSIDWVRITFEVGDSASPLGTQEFVVLLDGQGGGELEKPADAAQGAAGTAELQAKLGVSAGEVGRRCARVFAKILRGER